MNLPSDQFSVKYYIARVLLVIPYVKRNFKYLMIGAVLGAIIGLVVDFYKLKDEKYEAMIVFSIENAGGNEQAAGISSLLGLSGGTESSNIFSTGNFEELVKLNLVYKQALMTPFKLNGKSDLLINYLLANTNDEDFDNYKTFRFPKNQLLSQVPSSQNYFLNYCAGKVMGLVTFKKESEKSSFRTLKVTTNQDTLTYLISQNILKAFTDIYIKNKTKKSTELVRLLSKRVDSLRNALYYSQGKLASFADQNQQLVFQSAKITADRLQMNTAQIQGLYTEAVRNLDSYRFSLAKETPLINVITQSELPLEKVKYRFGIATIIGIMLGFFVSVLVIFLVKVYKEVFND